MSAVVVFAVAALGSYGLRASMVATGAGERLSGLWLERLPLIAPVMLSAIVAGSLFVHHGSPTTPVPAKVAAVLAAVVAVRVRGSLNAAFVVGFPVYWVAAALGAG